MQSFPPINEDNEKSERKRPLKRLNRIWCVLLVLCLLVSVVPFGASAVETDASETTDFVLVLDCSGSLMGNDRKLAISACKMFVDLIPVENARVSVITIGGTSGVEKIYSFSDGFLTEMEEYKNNGLLKYTFATASRENLQDLYQVVELGSAETLAIKQSCKDRIHEAAKRIGDQTPLTHALAAALDMLEQNGAQPGNACVVLLTDGEMTSEDVGESLALKSWVIDSAAGNQWPIYCIDTNFGEDVDRGLLDEISKGSGYANGKMKSENAVEICGHFLEIFNHFMENKNGTQQKVDLKNGVAEHQFSIPMLSSETNIVVAGSDAGKPLDINMVELYKVGSNTPIISVTNTDVNKEIKNPTTVTATAEDGVYYCLKMIAPPAGDYVLRAYGPDNSSTSILVYDSSIQEMDLSMKTSPAGEDGSVTIARDQVINVNATFSYAGYEVSCTDEVERGYYEKQTAVLYAFDTQDNVLFYDEMSIGDNGYHYDLRLSETEIPSDRDFRIAVRIEKNDMYRTGEKESNSVWFVAGNRALVPTCEEVALQGHVNMEMDQDILLGNLYTEEDGDLVTYDLVDFKQVLDSGTVSVAAFEHGRRPDTDAVWIKAGLKPGQYEATLVLKEAGSDASHKILVKMDVRNDPIAFVQPEKPIEIWTDFFPFFQNDEFLTWSGDISEYFSDQEGVPMVFSVGEGGASGLLEIDHVEGKGTLQLKAAGEETGKTELTVVAKQYDGDELLDSLEVSIPVVVTSGRVEFWKDNWIWFALAAALIALIVIIIVFLSLSTRVKGIWEISYEENGVYTDVATVRVSSTLPCGRKKKFMLHEMVTQVNNFSDGQAHVIANVPNYFVDEEIRRIQLQGIALGTTGFIAKNIPNNDQKIVVEYLGRTHTNKMKVTGGRVQFTIKQTDAFGIPSVLTITMNCVGK